MTDYANLRRLLAEANVKNTPPWLPGFKDHFALYPEDHAVAVAAVNALPSLLDRIKALEGALKKDQERQERAVATFRREGFVFDGKKGRWQKLAFSLYTDLVESSEAARAILAEGAGE